MTRLLPALFCARRTAVRQGALHAGRSDQVVLGRGLVGRFRFEPLQTFRAEIARRSTGLLDLTGGSAGRPTVGRSTAVG